MATANFLYKIRSVHTSVLLQITDKQGDVAKNRQVSVSVGTHRRNAAGYARYCRFRPPVNKHLIISPIAIAYSMGQIIKSVCVCQSVSQSVCQCICLSVCEHSRGRISSSIFTKIGTEVCTPKRKNEFVRGQYRTTPSPILPHKTTILSQKVLKTHANIK